MECVPIQATGTDQYNILVNNGKDSGQEVPHVHFHIIPRKAGDYTACWAKVRHASVFPEACG